jgi:hypothetical protein
MSLPNWMTRTPEYWDSYLPQAGDYDDAQGYVDALAAGAEDTSPVIGGYYNEGTDEWIGGRHTERDIALNQLKSAMDPNSPYNKGAGGASMRIKSWMSLHPEQARDAYFARDEYGNPRLDPAILAMMEQVLGITGYEAPVTPGAPTGPSGPGGPANEIPGRLPPRDEWHTQGIPQQPEQPDRTGWYSEGIPQQPAQSGGGMPDRGALPDQIGGGLPMEPATFTQDPRYPDFILRGKSKWGPKPYDRLGVY